MGAQGDQSKWPAIHSATPGHHQQRAGQAHQEHAPARTRHVDLAAAQADVQAQGVEAGAQADRQRQAGVANMGTKRLFISWVAMSTPTAMSTGVRISCLA
jgi:hypothetical protein